MEEEKTSNIFLIFLKVNLRAMSVLQHNSFERFVLELGVSGPLKNKPTNVAYRCH
jgi:hypothetical protein